LSSQRNPRWEQGQDAEAGGQGCGTPRCRPADPPADPGALGETGTHRASGKASESPRSPRRGKIPEATGEESTAGTGRGAPSAPPPRSVPAPGRLRLHRPGHEVPAAGGTVPFPAAELEGSYGWGERGRGGTGAGGTARMEGGVGSLAGAVVGLRCPRAERGVRAAQLHRTRGSSTRLLVGSPGRSSSWDPPGTPAALRRSQPT